MFIHKENRDEVICGNIHLSRKIAYYDAILTLLKDCTNMVQSITAIIIEKDDEVYYHKAISYLKSVLAAFAGLQEACDGANSINYFYDGNVTVDTLDSKDIDSVNNLERMFSHAKFIEHELQECRDSLITSFNSLIYKDYQTREIDLYRSDNLHYVDELKNLFDELIRSINASFNAFDGYSLG